MAAANLLKRHQAVVWLPPRGVGERALVTEAVLLVAHGGAADRAFRRMSLDALPKVKSVTLLFDARDVTLIDVEVPQLPPARLIRALPNIVEDALLQDAASCAFALGPATGAGRRLVAVMDRSWLEFAVGAFERRGMTVTGALPTQLALPVDGDALSIACVHRGLAVRSGPMTGFGWAGGEQADGMAEGLVSALQALESPAEGRQAIIFLEDEALAAPVLRAAQGAGLATRLAPLPLPVSSPAVDLLDARQGSAGQRWLANVDWRAWRWPAALAGGCLAVWLLGLNLHWGQLAGERGQLKADMERRFREAFPNAQVVVDPVLQMERQIGALRARAGQSGPEDFVPLMARFAAALGARGTDALAAIDYREGRLKVRFQSTFVESQAARDALREACARSGLKLAFDDSTPASASVSLSR